MKLLQVEAEEPPSRPQATSQSFSKTHSLINALAPAHKPRLDEVVVRLERFPVGPQTRAFRKRFYPEIDAAQWNDWRWQARSRIRTLAELERIFVLSDDERDAVVRHQGSLPLGITPYYASLMAREDALEPLRRTHIPVGSEYLKTPGEADDPLGEDGHSAVPGLVHRYPDRVLFLATGFCSTYCRYCTRSRMVGEAGGDYTFSRPQWDEALNYIADHPEIRDVLISGGDPLTLSDERLDYLLGPPAGHQACRVRAARHQSAGRAADAGDAVADPRAQEASSAVDEPSLHPSDRAHPRGHRGHDAAGRRRHSARQPDGAAQGHQRFGRDAEAAVPRAADAPGAALLPLSVRPDLGLVAFPHQRRQGARDHPGPARPHHRLCRADLCDRRARRRRQDPAASRTMSSAARATT